jgi:proton glutamate symport protein
MSFTARVLTGLFAGLAAGIAIDLAGIPWLESIPPVVEPIGTLFINGIRMTVIPLVVASLIAGVAAARDQRSVGRTGGTAAVIFLAGVSIATLFAVLVGYPALAFLEIDPAVSASIFGEARAGQAAAEGLSKVPGFAEWLIGLVPINPVKAAADGTMLPLIVFSLAFGFALAAVEGERRAAVVRFFQGISDAMLLLVGWVLKLAPVGVFALALPLAARMGIAAAGVLAYYIALVSAVSLAFILFILCPAAVLFGRVPFQRFLKATLPAATVGFTSRSSLAALPAAIEGAREHLRLKEETAAFFLPLAASMFRMGAAIGQVVGVLFIASLYGVEIGAASLATMLVIIVLTSFSVPGVPAGAIIMITPVLLSAGLPVEGIGLLIGVDTIPDMFRTAANVVGWMAGAAIVRRREGTPDAVALEPAAAGFSRQ